MFDFDVVTGPTPEPTRQPQDGPAQPSQAEARQPAEGGQQGAALAQGASSSRVS